MKALFEAGAIRVDGRHAKKGQMLTAGQEVSVELPELADGGVPAQPELPLAVLFSNETLIFIDKPSGLPSHPLEPGERGTVGNALIARYPECREASEEPRECGLCHRLDTETSGVLLASRTRPAWTAMRQAFTDRKVDKRYWALVTGPIGEEGEIDLPLRHRGDRVEPSPAAGREALTHFRVLSRAGESTLVEARIETGVLHQVRAHLAAIGAPIVGDKLYGGRASGRLFLHARALAVPGAPRVESPLPPELSATLSEFGLSA